MISDDGNYRWDGTAWQPNPPPKKPNTTKFVIAAVVVVGLFGALLIAGANQPVKVAAPPAVVGAPTTAPTTTTEAPTTTAPPTKQERFYDALADQPGLSKYANSATVDLMGSVCTGITDDGVSTTMGFVVEAAVKNDIDTHDLGVIFAVGVPIYCPQHSAALKAWGANQ